MSLREMDDFTFSGKTIDLLLEEITQILNHGTGKDITEQTHIELVNFAEALKAPSGMTIRFEFDYNS